MDSNNDHLHGYPTPMPTGLNLFMHASPFGGLVCPVCPNHMPHGWNKADARELVLEKARGLRDDYYTKDKNIARYHTLVRN